MLSVAVASRDRATLLESLLVTLVAQLERTGEPFEIVVADDGSQPPYDLSAWPQVRLVRTEGVGPARARNRALRDTHGEIVLITDDDVQLDDQWVRTAVAYLGEHPEAAGVSGRTSAAPHDELYEHAVEDLVGGNFLTCNVAYRRDALVAVGGFDERFSHAHEDRDLAWRVIDQVGPVGVEPTMRVVHPGRAFSVRAYVSRARFVYDDWLLFQRYPDRRVSTHSVRWTPLRNTVRTWRDVAVRRRPWRSPRDLGRFIALAGGQITYSAYLCSTRWRRLSDRALVAQGGLDAGGLRIAYVGPSPDPTAGGAPGVAGLLVGELVARGHLVDCFVAASREDDDPRALGERRGLTYVIGRSGFAFGRWYSSSRLSKMVSMQAYAALARRRLAARLLALHRASPYDLVYQFSTLESFGVPRRRQGLTVIIHPSVHAAGERRWVLKEARTGMSDDGVWRTAAVLAWLRLRERRQRHDARRADGIVALSPAFAEQMAADYGLDPRRIRVVPNCIDVAALAHITGATGHDVVVVGRLAVRKGLEDAVGLTQRLAAIDDRLRLRVIGAPSLWSDYTKALRVADMSVTDIVGPLQRERVFEEISRSLVLAQLSRYEPFGLAVAEALALGVPVIVTPAVGAAEFVSEDVKILVEPFDIDALADAVGSLCAMRDDERDLLAHRCRHEAARHFAPAVVATQLERALVELIS